MEFITGCTGKKRQMMYVPDVNPNSLLLFFERGNSGYSYSLRDYSDTNRVIERYAREFPWTADEIRHRSRYLFDAPTVDTNNLAFWHDYTANGNEYLRREGALPNAGSLPAPSSLPTTSLTDCQYPILNAAAFKALPKSAKTGDLERILNSPQSEDWVTWNMLNLLLMFRRETWWMQLSACAKGANPNLVLPSAEGEPRVRFWRVVPSPTAYETASRERMLRSADPRIVARSHDRKPVEGNSEIDIVIESNSFVIYIEAKLNADVSMRTTYDPTRNQIVRNIDCMLESATGRIPYFWMFVRHATPARAYVSLMRQYHERPEILFRELPHRDPAVLRELARGLVVLTWRDISAGICDPNPGDSELLLSVKRELRRRIQTLPGGSKARFRRRSNPGVWSLEMT